MFSLLNINIFHNTNRLCSETQRNFIHSFYLVFNVRKKICYRAQIVRKCTEKRAEKNSKWFSLFEQKREVEISNFEGKFDLIQCEVYKVRLNTTVVC